MDRNDDEHGGVVGIMGGGRHVIESQHALMSAAMLDAKRARMKVENDREALANRIARLQAEELRATKRIEQTVKGTPTARFQESSVAHQHSPLSACAASAHTRDPVSKEPALSGPDQQKSGER